VSGSPGKLRNASLLACVGVGALALALLGGSPAKAAFTFEFDHDLNSGTSGLTPDTSGGPFATARFEDINTNPNQVSITVTNMMAANELDNSKPRITQLVFNTEPFLGPDNVTLSPPLTPPPSNPPNWTSSYASNSERLEGGGLRTRGFDLSLKTTDAIQSGIQPGKALTFIVTDITSAPGTFSSNNFLATNFANFYAAAKVQGIGSQDQSTEIVVRRNPIPGPVPIFGAAMAFGYSRGLRRRLNQGTPKQFC
jgi:hypothetical protein